MTEQPTTPALAETMTRLADGPRSKWHDEVLPNGAGESWVCVPIGDVLAALPSAPPALDVERLAEALCGHYHGPPAGHFDSEATAIHRKAAQNIAALYARLEPS